MLKTGTKSVSKKRGLSNGRVYQAAATASALLKTRSWKSRIQKGKHRDADLVEKFVHQIGRELVVNFGKTNAQAQVMVNEANLNDYLVENPIALHDSPHQWAIKLLTKFDDDETLERYYSS